MPSSNLPNRDLPVDPQLRPRLRDLVTRLVSLRDEIGRGTVVHTARPDAVDYVRRFLSTVTSSLVSLDNSLERCYRLWAERSATQEGPPTPASVAAENPEGPRPVSTRRKRSAS